MNKFYYKSPVFIQNLLTSLYGYKLKRIRYKKDYFQQLEEYKSQNFDEEYKLSELLSHISTNIEAFKEITSDNISSPIDVLKSIDFMEKEDLRNSVEKYTDKSIAHLTNKTGGTTGKSLKVYSSKEDVNKRMAYLDYIKTKFGVELFSKRASFTGKEIVPQNHKNILWRTNYAINQRLYASFKINKDNVKFIYKDMTRFKPSSIDGFPSAIHLVAKYILSNNININWNVKAIFPTAETLTDNMREDIERAFKTKVVNQYASSEGAPFLYSIDGGNFHIGHETGLFEFFKVEDSIYDMVVTSYINYATPLIRYKIGDQVIINSDEEYLNTYKNNPEITKILGRATDYLVGNDNNIVTSANMSNVYKDFGSQIIQSQFIQNSKNEFEINLVVTNQYMENKNIGENKLIEKLNHRLGVHNIYQFNYMDEIPKEKSGKTRFIINRMGGKK